MSEPNVSRAASEKVMNWMDAVRLWVSQSSRIAMRMLRGAYLIDERNRLLARLGAHAFERLQKGDWQDSSLAPLLQQLDRLTRKVELEEQLIRHLRFGTETERPTRTSPESAHRSGEGGSEPPSSESKRES